MSSALSAFPSTGPDSASLPDPYVPPDGTFNITGSVAISADLTLTAFTAGSILFAGTAGLVTQDNANLFWDNTNNQIVLGAGTAAAPAYTFASDQDTGLYRVSANSLALAVAGAAGLTLATTGATATQAVSTSGSPTLFTMTGAAHTTLAASAEATDLYVNLGRTVQFATGALATQRAVRIAAPTYGFAGASTLTNAATFYVDAAPTAGTNATLTNAYAVWIDAGATRTDGVIFAELGSVTNAAYSFLSAGTTDPNTGLYSTGADNASVAAGGTRIASFATTGTTLTQAVSTSGSPTGLTFTGVAHTTLAASTEATDVNFNLARTVQFATGALTTQRAFRVQAPTYAFSGSSTLTTAITAEISGAPTQAVNGNIVITQAIALSIAGGAVTLESQSGTYSRNISLAARTITLDGTGQITSSGNAGIFVNSATYTNTSASTLDIAAGITVVAPIAAGSVSMTQVSGFRLADNVSYAAHGAGFNYAGYRVVAHTLTFTGTTQITSSPAAAGVSIAQITLTNTSAHTIDSAASLYIANAPVAGGSVTLTSAYALWVDAGNIRSDGVLFVADGSAAAPSLAWLNDTDTGFYVASASAQLSVSVSGAERGRFQTTGLYLPGTLFCEGFQAASSTGRATFSAFAGMTLTQSAQTSGSAAVFIVTGAAHTTLAASTEATDVNFNLARTVQFATGALTLQRALRIQPQTIGFAGASTLSTAITASIDGLPIPGTNATFTQAVCLALNMANITLNANTRALQIGAFTQTISATISNHRTLDIEAPTFTAAAAQTVTVAACIYINNAPVAGTNVTITNTYAIWVDAGIARFDGDGTTVFTLPTLAATDTVITRKIRILDGATTYWVAATTSQ